MTTHTPGPWAIDHHLPPNPRSIIARTCDGVGISGNTVGPHAESENAANARLIAAAPDLLAALRDAMRWLPNPDAPEIDERQSVGVRIAKAARAAIAKAEGGEA